MTGWMGNYTQLTQDAASNAKGVGSPFPSVRCRLVMAQESGVKRVSGRS